MTPKKSQMQKVFNVRPYSKCSIKLVVSNSGWRERRRVARIPGSDGCSVLEGRNQLYERSAAQDQMKPSNFIFHDPHAKASNMPNLL